MDPVVAAGFLAIIAALALLVAGFYRANEQPASVGERYRPLIEELYVGVIEFDCAAPAGTGGSPVIRVAAVNPAASRMLASDLNRMLGQTLGEAFPDFTRSNLPDLMLDAALAGKVTTLEVRIDDERYRKGLYLIRTVNLATDRVALVIQEAKPRPEATTPVERRRVLRDKLTGLPNQVLFLDRMAHAVAFSRREERPMAVLVFSLDQLEEINERKGHRIGDRLIAQFADRLNRQVRDADSFARLGGDRFAVLITGDMEASQRLMGRVLDMSRIPYVIDGEEEMTSLTAGIAVYPDHGADAETLLDVAEGARRRAKRQRLPYLVANRPDAPVAERDEIAEALARARTSDTIKLRYQPVFDLSNEHVVAVEAYAYWDDPSYEAISPAQFLAVAETSGLMADITARLLGEAAATARYLRDQNVVIPVHLNLSATDVVSGMIARIAPSVLAQHSLEQGSVVFEIPASVAAARSEETCALMAELDRVGFPVVIDRCGSAAQLAGLGGRQFAELKLDRSLTASVTDGPAAADRLQRLVGAAANHGAIAVAEGVELDVVRRELTSIGCTRAQGWLWSAAVEPEEIVTLAVEARDPR